jgi:hypothetical protein
MASSISTAPLVAALTQFTKCKQELRAAEQSVDSLARRKLREALERSLKQCALEAQAYCETGTLAEVVLILLNKPSAFPNQEAIDKIFIRTMIQGVCEITAAQQRDTLSLPQVLLEIQRAQGTYEVDKRNRKELMNDASFIRSVVKDNDELRGCYSDVMQLLTVREERASEKVAASASNLAKIASQYMSRGGNPTVLAGVLFQDQAAKDRFIREASAFLAFINRWNCSIS